MIVSYCSGIGGLDLAVERVFDTHTGHLFEVDHYCDVVLAARFPDAERWGDLSGDDSAGIEVGDGTVVAAGFPCQDISLAGKGAGLDGERSGLWFTILDHIETIRPEWVAVENVPALAKRGLDAVLDGLGAAGYGGVWTFWRAGYMSKNRQRFPHVGAPHQRKRLFILARRGYAGGFRQVEAKFDGQGGDVDRLLSTPTAWDGARGPDLARADRPDAGGMDLVTTVERLLPTPTARDHKGRNQRDDDTCLPGAVDRLPLTFDEDVGDVDVWGVYAPAVARWGTRLGRPAPNPVVDGRVNPALVEWMMGFPAGWITDLDIPRTQQLKMLGNAVVQQQAEAALTYMKTRMTK